MHTQASSPTNQLLTLAQATTPLPMKSKELFTADLHRWRHSKTCCRAHINQPSTQVLTYDARKPRTCTLQTRFH